MLKKLENTKNVIKPVVIIDVNFIEIKLVDSLCWRLALS